MYWYSDSVSKSALLTCAGGIASRAASRDRGQHPRAAGEQRGADSDAGPRGDDRPLSPDPRDQDQRREEGPDEAAGGRQRVQPSRDAPGLLHGLQGEPHQERSRRAERCHRDREQRERGEEGPDDRSDRDRVDSLDRPAQQRSRGERRHRERRRRDEQDRRQHPRLRPPVGQPTAEPVPEREVREGQPDDVRPHHRRGAEVRREQARSRDLRREGGTSDQERDETEPHTGVLARSRARGDVLAPDPATRSARPARRRPSRPALPAAR